MTFNAVGSGTSMSAYVDSLLSKTSGGTNNDSTTSTATSAAAKAAAKAALSVASHSFKSTGAQQKLEQRQAALGGDLRSAMAKAGVTLQGSIELSVGSDGNLKVAGSDKDTAAAIAFLKADSSKPSLASRVTSLAADANALSTSLQQSAAISQAARYAGRGGNVMSLYGSLLKQQDASSAVLTLSSSGTSLSYPGVLTSKA